MFHIQLTKILNSPSQISAGLASHRTANLLFPWTVHTRNNTQALGYAAYLLNLRIAEKIQN